MIPGGTGTCLECGAPARSARAQFCEQCRIERIRQRNARASSVRVRFQTEIRREDRDAGDLSGEAWQPIPRWEGLYEVSSLGRVRTVLRTVEAGKITQSVGWRIRKLHTDRGGAVRCTLMTRSPPRQEIVRVDLLVEKLFFGGSNVDDR